MLSPHQLAVALLLFATGFPATSPAASLSQSVPAFSIYRFTGTPDGATPSGGLVQDSQGRLYGGTQSGGAMGQGTIYRLTRQTGQKWTEDILYSFSGSDGSVPSGPLTLDASGNVYGVTSAGGPTGHGEVFALSNASGGWNLTVLHSFGSSSQDGIGAFSGVVFGPEGNLFGVTQGGGASNFGTAFELSPSGDANLYARIHDFAGGSDGLEPLTRLHYQRDRLVGTTFGGGTSNAGTVFTLSEDENGKWHEQVVYNFASNSNDFHGPSTAQGFVSNDQGGFFGCGNGGPFQNGGVFTVAPQSGSTLWNESILYAFGQKPSDPKDGCDLLKGPGGVIYGTAPYGGGAKVPSGVVFSLSPPSSGSQNWTETNLINLSANGSFLGRQPIGGVIRQNRFFYGVSTANRNGSGLDFVFVPFGAP